MWAAEPPVPDSSATAQISPNEKKLVGIFTERDVVRKCICQSRGSEETCVSDIMTPSPTVVGVNGNLTQALHIMLQGHFRHLPIVDGDEVLGIPSMLTRALGVRNHTEAAFKVGKLLSAMEQTLSDPVWEPEG